MLSKTQKLYCKKHGVEFNGKLLLGKVAIGCPMCSKEAEAQKEREMALEVAKKEKELLEFKEYRVANSGLPKRLIEAKAKYTQNFKEHAQHLIELKCNLFLCGGVGTGKSMYCAELIKRNTNRYPRYYNAGDMSFYTNYEKTQMLQSISNCELFVIDEVGDIGLVDKVFLKSLFDRLYNQGAIIVLAGNVNSGFLQSLDSKIISRLSENNLTICEFIGKDLRVIK